MLAVALIDASTHEHAATLRYHSKYVNVILIVWCVSLTHQALTSALVATHTSVTSPQVRGLIPSHHWHNYYRIKRTNLLENGHRSWIIMEMTAMSPGSTNHIWCHYMEMDFHTVVYSCIIVNFHLVGFGLMLMLTVDVLVPSEVLPWFIPRLLPGLLLVPVAAP